MSGLLEEKLAADRALRNAALALVKADIVNLRTDLATRSIGGRVFDRASEGAVDIFEEAKDFADDHKGALATLVAAIFVWFARTPIADWFSNDDDGDDDDAIHKEHCSDDNAHDDDEHYR